MAEHRCGGSRFHNPHRNINRMFTLCGKFIDADDGADLFPDVTCPDCVNTVLYERWITELAVMRISGAGRVRWQEYNYYYHMKETIPLYRDKVYYLKSKGMDKCTSPMF